jgi:peptide chain release factor 1
MKSSTIAKLEALLERHGELELRLGNSDTAANQDLFRRLSREYCQLTGIIKKFCAWQEVQLDIAAVQAMSEDSEMHDIVQEELNDLYTKKNILEKEIKLALLPKEPHDSYSCFMEIRAGTGGDEAAIFAGDLLRMYSRYAESKSWQVNLISTHSSELGGYKEVILHIRGNSVYGSLKFESGGHRVQRLPETESQGRIHTSTCTIAIIPDLPKAKLPDINPSDLKIDTFRSSGAGGQHVNTTDSAIRITHIPTGIVVGCQAERSQHKNKAKALAVLGSRINAYEMEKNRSEEASIRRGLLGSGDRSDRIRTYNFPQGRVTDHRIKLTLYRLEEVMSGKLSTLIEPVIQEHQSDQLTDLY